MNQNIWVADAIYFGNVFRSGLALVCDASGQITKLTTEGTQTDVVRLKDRAILPGLVNAHSHAFQRVIRGRTEYRTSNKDSFWTWREMMYDAASRLTPDDVYDASRMAFLEMALSGITCVGEFHYLHHSPDGQPYDDPNLLAKQVIRAARDVGLRISLLRVAYARAGFETESNPRQDRFIESDPEVYLKNVERLIDDLKSPNDVAVGVAPHSVRAVPLGYIKQVIDYAGRENLPVHMHVAEQPAEVSACIAEYGRSPVALLHSEGLLSKNFTGVHVIHVTRKAIASWAESGATVCACPTTERNLGDGIVPVDSFMKHRVPVALGTDSHVEINLLEDARELEYHLRLQKQERVVLSTGETDGLSSLASRLFEFSTLNGARSLHSPGGMLDESFPADFFTVDLNDPSIAGSSEGSLLSNIMFSMSRTAIKDVVVGGKRIVEDGKHPRQDEIIQRFKALQGRLWGEAYV